MPALKSEGCFNDWSLYRLHKYARTFHFFSPHIAKKASRETYPYNFMRERISREFSKLIWSLRSLLYPFLKPDQNSVCCLLLNYVSLKHKCVGFRKLQISAFPYDLGKCNFNQFYLGWKKYCLHYFMTQGSCQPTWPSNFCGRESFLASQMVSNKAYTFHINATDNL